MIATRKKVLLALWNKYLADNISLNKQNDNQKSLDRLHSLDRWLLLEFKKNKSFGKRDRAWYSDFLFSALRFSITALAVDFLLNSNKSDSKDLSEFLKSPNENKIHFILEKLHLINPEVFWAVIENRMFQKNEIFLEFNPLEKLKFLENSESIIGYSLYHGLGPEFLKHLNKRAEYSKWELSQLRDYISKQSKRAPLWLRASLSEKITAIEEDLALIGEEIQTKESCALLLKERTRSGRALLNTNSYEGGFFEIQDWASQQILNSLPLEENYSYWDACAGGGGKTLQLFSLLEAKGIKNYRVCATDLRAHKLEDLNTRLKRLYKNKNVETYAFDLLKQKSEKKHDVVMVDAPCSSSGTLKRNPEIKWGCYDVISFQATQIKILETVSKNIKAGGFLLYATCSVFVEENESVVDEFTKKYPQFKLEKSEVFSLSRGDSDTTYSALLRFVQ